eukprot:12907886-Prorocentrum_lima.AAC.1
MRARLSTPYFPAAHVSPPFANGGHVAVGDLPKESTTSGFRQRTAELHTPQDDGGVAGGCSPTKAPALPLLLRHE